MTNQKGSIILAIPLTLALIGLLGTGVFTGLDHEKEVLQNRDNQRKQDITLIESRLADYHAQYQVYPVQKNEADNDLAVLQEAFNDISQDPMFLKGMSYRYWSDGQAYTLRYMSEASHQEIVVFSE